MYGTRPGQRQNKPTPPKAKPRKTTDPDDDFGGGEGKGEDSAGNKVKKPRKGGGGDFDGGEGKKEEKTRKDPPKKPAKKPAKKPVKKPVRAKGPHPMARFFRIERVAIAGNLTNAGTYPEVQLQFKAFKRVKFITVIWYCMTKKGHIFWAVHTFFGPDLNKVHRKVAALTPKQETKFGRITAGRVEIYYGSYKDRELLAVGKTGKVLKQFIGKTWWEPEEDYEGQMILYAPKTHPFETNTLKRYRSKH
jgi:hypothetical protein